MRTLIFTFVILASPVLTGSAFAQIPVEVFGGDKKMTLDLMFFRYFTDAEEKATPWLFFNRNRASYDYRMTETAYLPSFGFTEAISYNAGALYGFAPVAVVQVLNRGAYTKLGVQYVNISKEITFFSWAVVQMQKGNDIDYFALFRYTPAVSPGLKAFLQAETSNTFPGKQGRSYSLTQRARAGVQYGKLAFGFAADLTETGVTKLSVTENYGGFVRYQF